MDPEAPAEPEPPHATWCNVVAVESSTDVDRISRSQVDRRGLSIHKYVGLASLSLQRIPCRLAAAAAAKIQLRVRRTYVHCQEMNIRGSEEVVMQPRSA